MKTIITHIIVEIICAPLKAQTCMYLHICLFIKSIMLVNIILIIHQWTISIMLIISVWHWMTLVVPTLSSDLLICLAQ